MQKQNRNAIFGDFATLSTLVILFASAVALVGCGGGGGGSTAPNDPASPPPCYDMNEEPLNDSFNSVEPIAAGAELFLLEGYIHHGDLDVGVILPYTPIANRDLSITFDYAYGWDMDVSVGYRDINDVEHTLWAAYDSWGHAALGTQTVTFPAEAMDITVTIGQRSGNVIPDSTRYTIEVEVL